MCDPITVAAIAFQAVSKISEGNQQKKMFDYQAEQAHAEAQAEREHGQVKADKTRKAGVAQTSSARAALAASGVETGAATPLRIESTITERTEADAVEEILFGSRKGTRLDTQGELNTMAGKNARSAGYKNAIGSVLSMGARTKPGWGGTIATQPPVAVEDRNQVRIG